MLKQFLMAIAAASSAAAQVKLEPVPLGFSAAYTEVLPLPGGGRLLLGTMPFPNSINFGATTTLHMVFSSPGSAEFVAPPVYGGHGNDIPHDAAVDPTGNVWVVGDTDSDDFTLVNPIVAQKVPYRTAGFVMEFDPRTGKLLFATYLGGQMRPSVGPPLYASHATAIAFDSTGNAYVGGDTDEPDFPATPGALLGGAGGADTFYNTHFYSYVLKISPAGKLAYSTEVATGASQCMGGSRCIGQMSTSETVSSLAIDAGGAVTLAGGAGGSWNLGSGYVSRVAADGSKLLWTWKMPATFGAVTKISMAPDAGGNLNLFGRYVTVLFFDPSIGPIPGTPGLFAGKLKGDGSAPLFLTDLGQSADAAAAGLVLDSGGNAWMAGTDSSPQLPSVAAVPNLGADFILRLDTTGSGSQKLFRLPRGTVTAPPAMDTQGNLLLVEEGSALLTFPSNYAFESPAIVGFANAASLALNTGIYPGTLATIYGFDLPASPQVSIDGVPAPVLYAGPNQINVQVPFAVAVSAQTATVQVMTPSGAVTVQTHPTPSAGLFTTDGVHAAALNQDGTVNSLSNPAAAGSIVSLFGTGAAWPPGTPDNTAAPSAMSLDQGGSGFQVMALLARPIPLNMMYFGSAPGIIQGVFQINVLLPQTSSKELGLQIRSVWFGDSDTVSVYVD